MIGVQRDPSLGHVSLNPRLRGRIIKPPAYLLTLLSSFACDRNPAGTKKKRTGYPPKVGKYGLYSARH